MNQTEYDKAIATLHEKAEKIVAVKRPDYTRENTDVLSNFKEAANRAKITPLQAWLVHFEKQYTAIARWATNPACTPSEPMISRFADLLNYTDLGWALAVEQIATLQKSPRCSFWKSMNNQNNQCLLEKGHVGECKFEAECI